MKPKDKTTTLFETLETGLKELSNEELKQMLDDYRLHVDEGTQQQLVQELQVHQIVMEVQNRKLLESQRQLEEARDRYADLYEFAPVCYITFDAAGCVDEVNLAGATLLGQERADLLGKPFPLWLKQSDNGQAFYMHLKQARESGRVENIDLQLQPSNSEQLDVRLETAVAYDKIQDKVSFRCVVIDISARKQVEREVAHQAQQLRLIADAIPGYIAYVDKYGIFQFVNKSYAAWIGKPQEEILGKKHMDVIRRFTNYEFEQYTIAALQGRTVNFETTVETPEGEKQDVTINYIPDYAQDGAVLGYFVVNLDVTELHLKETIDKMHMLEVAHVARINTMGEMVAELAHELNQPLAAISIYSDAVSRMLSKQAPDHPEMQEALNEIRLQARRAGDVITRLREFVSKRELQIENIQINDLVEEVMKLITVEARWHGVDVKLELGQGIPQINVDRILIEQVVLNLARNAIEAMEAIEQGKRGLVIRTLLGNHKEIEISVTDSGPGIPIEEMEQIFEPFFTSKANGMGMGLAISRSIIKAHQGRLWAIPNEYGGTTFTLIFPHQIAGVEK